jgi:outer membrane protein TolC
MKYAMKYHYSLLLLAALCRPAAAQAQDHSLTAYTLPACLEIALENAYSIRFARNSEQVAANNASRGNAGMLPAVNAAADLGGSFGYLPLKDSATQGNSYKLGVSGSWTVFDGWGMQASYERLQEIKKNGELATQLQIAGTVAQVTAMYYEIVQRQLRLKNLKAMLSLSRERMRLAREKFMAGSHSQLELLQAQVDFNADSSQYVTYLQSCSDLQIRFKTLLLLPFDDSYVIVNDTSFRLNQHLRLEELQALAVSNNTSLKIFDVNRTITDLERKQVEAARYPYVNLSASYGYSGNFSNTKKNAMELSYGVSVGVNIFNGYNQRRQEANVKIAQLNRQLEYEQQLQQVMADLHQLYSSYDTYIHLLDLEKSNKAMADRKIGLALELYSLGQITSLELREHQKTSLDAQDRLVNAIYQAKLSEIYLLQLCGAVLYYLNIKPVEE